MIKNYALWTAAFMLSGLATFAQGPKPGVHAHTGTPHLRGGGPPANDECAGALPLTVGTTCTTTLGNSEGATQSMDPGVDCNPDFTSPNAFDVWYSFEATSDYTRIDVTGVQTYDAIVQLFSGTCANLVAMACADDNYPDTSVDPIIDMTESLTAPTTIGTTYFVRVYYYSSPLPVDFDFNICVLQGEAPPPPPANDECSSVTPETMSVGGTVEFTGTTVGATNTNDFAAGSVLEGEAATVWHAFTTTECMDLKISYCGSDPVQADNWWIFVSPTCPAGDDIVIANNNGATCADGNPEINYLGLPPGTYYLPVMMTGTGGPYSLTLTSTACPPPPANDECANAIPVTSAATCTLTSSTVAGATESMASISCNGATATDALDVWYSFVATSTDQTILVVGDDENGDLDPVIEVFSGTCAALNSVDCGDYTASPTDSLVSTAFTVGQTYYFRVYNYGGVISEPFSICVREGVETSITDITAATNWSTFPNPTNGDITISGKELAGNNLVELTDMTGRVVYTDRLTMTQGQNTTLHLGGKLATGTYTLTLTTAKGRSAHRVMVK